MNKLTETIQPIPKDVLKQHFTRSTLCRHMRGSRTPSLESARKYAELLGISLDEFYRRIR